MTRRRLTLALCLGLAAIVAPVTASAATRTAPVCKLIVDHAGDEDWSDSLALKDSAMDIVSADIASNGKTLTAVIRVKKLIVPPDPNSPVGNGYYFIFTTPGSDRRSFLAARLFTVGTGPVFSFGHLTELDQRPTREPYGANDLYEGVTGAVDLKKSEVRISVPITAIKPWVTISAKRPLYGLTARTFIQFAGQGVYNTPYPKEVEQYPLDSPEMRWDNAYGYESVYWPGTRSCVRVGA